MILHYDVAVVDDAVPVRQGEGGDSEVPARPGRVVPGGTQEHGRLDLHSATLPDRLQEAGHQEGTRVSAGSQKKLFRAENDS